MAKQIKLGTANSFSAIQVPGQVFLFATGKKPTPRTRVWLEASLVTVFPPEYILRSNPPADPDIQIITPFLAEVTFRAFEPVKSVTVRDAAGVHKVKVIQAPSHPPKGAAKRAGKVRAKKAGSKASK